MVDAVEVQRGRLLRLCGKLCQLHEHVFITYWIAIVCSLAVWLSVT